MDKINCETLFRNINQLENIKSTYCYNTEKLENGYCISINYQIWLLNLDYQKYCLNNISGNNKK